MTPVARQATDDRLGAVAGLERARRHAPADDAIGQGGIEVAIVHPDIVRPGRPELSLQIGMAIAVAVAQGHDPVVAPRQGGKHDSLGGDRDLSHTLEAVHQHRAAEARGESQAAIVRGASGSERRMTIVSIGEKGEEKRKKRDAHAVVSQ